MSLARLSAAAGLVAIASGAHATILGSEISQDVLISFEVSDLDATTIGPFGINQSGVDIQGLAANPATGEVWGISAGAAAAFTIDITTGAATQLTSTNTFRGNANGLAYDANRHVLWAASNSGEVWQYDIASGNTTSIGFVDRAALEGLAFDPATDTLYAINDVDDRIYTLDTTTLAATPITAPLDGGFWRGLTFDGDTGTIVASRVGGATAATFINVVDPATGMVIQSGVVSNAAAFTQGLAYVPTPGSLALLALGGLAATRRRR